MLLYVKFLEGLCYGTKENVTLNITFIQNLFCYLNLHTAYIIFKFIILRIATGKFTLRYKHSLELSLRHVTEMFTLR